MHARVIKDEYHSNKTNLTVSAWEWDRNRFEIDGSALERNSISSCTRAKSWMFDSVYFEGNQVNLFRYGFGVFQMRCI